MDGLTIAGGSSTVRGPAINRFTDNGWPYLTGVGIKLITNGGNTIEGSYIGTDVTRAVDLGNIRDVHIDTISNNTIGGTAAGARNVISGNNHFAGSGVNIVGSAATGNVVQGNFIGTDVTGA